MPPILRLVLDTNVVLDCVVFRDPAAQAIAAALESARAVAIVRDDALGELARVLAYPQFALDATAQAAAFARYCGWTESVGEPRAFYPLPACKDRDDQKFLEIARDGGASHLVTKDKALLVLARRARLRSRFEVVTPAAFASTHTPAATSSPRP